MRSRWHVGLVSVWLGGFAALAAPSSGDDTCAYVASVTANRISVVDLAARRVTGAIAALGEARDGVSVDGAGRAYVLQGDPDTASPVATVIDTATHAVVARFELPDCAYGRLRSDPARGRVFVSEACDDGIRVLDAAGATLAELPGCAGVADLGIVPGADALFVAAPRCDGLRRIDLATLASRVVALPGEVAVAALVPAADGAAYAVEAAGAIRRIDAGGVVDQEPLFTLPSGATILDAAPASDPRTLYVLAGGGFDEGALYRVDLDAARADRVGLAHPIGGRDRLATGPDRRPLVVTHYSAGIVEIVEGTESVAALSLAPGLSGAAVFSAACQPPPLEEEVRGVRASAAPAVERAAPAARAPRGRGAGTGVDEWYVDCSAGESGDGSPEHPWRTIAEAAREVRGGGPEGDDDGRADVVHVRGGPCQVENLGFNAALSGPGPDCLADDAACTVFRGEPGAVQIVGGSSKRDGFLVQNGVEQLKLENFIFVGDVLTDPANVAFGEPVKIGVGGASHIVLSNVSVVSGALVHDAGIKVVSEGPQAAHDILIAGGEVRGVAGVGYTLGGPPDVFLADVTLRETAAIANGGDGYVISKDSRGVANAVFDRTRAEGNAGDGYDVYAAFEAAPDQITVFSGVTAVGNGPPDCEGSSQGVGIKAWHSVRIADAVIEDNCQSGISLRRSESSDAHDTSVGVGTIVDSTVINNARVGGVQIDLSRVRASYTVTNCTLSSSEGKSAFSYLRRYACAEGPNEGDACSAAADCLESACGPGGTVTWNESTLHRNDTGKLVSFVDHAGVTHVCKNDQAEVETCDVAGDCNFDFRVSVAELIRASSFALRRLPLSACAQIDVDGDRRASVDELVRAVSVSLGATRQVTTDPPD